MADVTEVCGPVDGRPNDHVGITVMGVTEDVSCTRSGTLKRLDSQVSAADSAFKSAVLSDINSLKSSVTEIKFDLHVLQTAGASQSQVKSNPCFIYVRVKLSDPTPLEQLNWSLCCPARSYDTGVSKTFLILLLRSRYQRRTCTLLFSQVGLQSGAIRTF